MMVVVKIWWIDISCYGSNQPSHDFERHCLDVDVKSLKQRRNIVFLTSCVGRVLHQSKFIIGEKEVPFLLFERKNVIVAMTLMENEIHRELFMERNGNSQDSEFG